MLTDPNVVRVTPRTLAYNTPGLVDPSQHVAPKQLLRFATGSVPLMVPRAAVSLLPSTWGENKPAPLAKRG